MTAPAPPLDLGELLDRHTVTAAASRVKHGDIAARNRASSVGWPCPSGARFLVLQRTVPGEDASPELQMIFEEGTSQEEPIAESLRRDGWEVWKPEKVDLLWPKYQISGRIDKLCRIPEAVAVEAGRDPARVYVLEIKTMSPYAYPRLMSWHDFLHAKYPYHRCYPAQMAAYLWLEERAQGVMVVKNKASAQKRHLFMGMNEWSWLAEESLQRATEANEHLAAGSLPPVTDYDAEVCPKCSRRVQCLPGERPIGTDVILSEELEERLARREELARYRSEYTALDASIKDSVKQMAAGFPGTWLCEDWVLEVKQEQQHRRAQPERDLTVTKVVIRRAKGDADESAGEE